MCQASFYDFTWVVSIHVQGSYDVGVLIILRKQPQKKTLTSPRPPSQRVIGPRLG